MKKLPFTQPTRFSTLPFWRGWYGQQSSTPTPSSATTERKVEFHFVTVPSFFHSTATVFGLSKTDSNGTPPKAS